AERLSWQGGASLFLATALNDLTGQLAPRAVARDKIEGQTFRPDRRQRQRPGVQEAQGNNGGRKDELAGVRVSGGKQCEGEPRHAELLRPRSQRRDSTQMGRRPGRKGHRRRARDVDRRGGRERQEQARVSHTVSPYLPHVPSCADMTSPLLF